MKLDYVKHFNDLDVYKKQRTLAKDIFQLSKKFPKEEKYSLTDQIRRSSRSIGAQIAEAWAKRLYPKHWISKLTDADGEQMETLHWLIAALDCGYMTETEFEQQTGHCQEIGKMLGSMIRKAESFTSDNSALHENSIQYPGGDDE